MKLGLKLESLGLPLRQALSRASALGVDGVQVDARGDLAPDRLSDTGRREFRFLLRSHNLELTALGAPLRFGLDHAENLDARIDYLRRVMTLSFELGPRLVVAEVGAVPADPESAAGRTMAESLSAVGLHGDRAGAVLAVESGFDSGAALNTYLSRFDTGGLGVNYDPANLLIHGHDPVANLHPLKDRIRHVHAKDARRAGASKGAREVPLGHGDIDWLVFTGTLAALEYRGYVVVEREGGADPGADVAAGVALLRRVMPA